MNLTDAHTMALTELRRHESLSEWNFTFDQSKRRFGRCSFRRKVIQLSAPLTACNAPRVVREIILHEVGHALSPRNAHHNEAWKQIVRSISGQPHRYWDDVLGSKSVVALFSATCSHCGEIYTRHKPLPLRKIKDWHTCSRHKYPKTYLTWVSSKPPLNGADINQIVAEALRGVMS